MQWAEMLNTVHLMLCSRVMMLSSSLRGWVLIRNARGVGGPIRAQSDPTCILDTIHIQFFIIHAQRDSV